MRCISECDVELYRACRGIVTADVSGWKLEYGDIATSDIGSLSSTAWGNKDLPRFGPSSRGKDLLPATALLIWVSRTRRLSFRVSRLQWWYLRSGKAWSSRNQETPLYKRWVSLEVQGGIRVTIVPGLYSKSSKSFPSLSGLRLVLNL